MTKTEVWFIMRKLKILRQVSPIRQPVLFYFRIHSENLNPLNIWEDSSGTVSANCKSYTNTKQQNTHTQRGT